MSGANITSNTIPSSAISGGISVSLPTTTMSATLNTQVGYMQTSTSGAGTYSGSNTVTSLTLNGPVGSVWLVFVWVNYGTPLGAYGVERITNNGNTLSGSYNGSNGPLFHECSLSTVFVVNSGTNGSKVEYAVVGSCVIAEIRFRAVRIA